MATNPFSLSNHTALVTGSSMGIGRAIAQGIHNAGAKVLLHGYEEKCEDPIPNREYICCDLLTEDGPQELIDKAFSSQPDLDLLVANAGDCLNAPFLEMTKDRWDRTMQLNLKGNYFLIQAFAKRLVSENRNGAVVITGSVNGFQAEMDSSVYDISKGGIVMMIRGLAMELGHLGIRVNGIAPGLIYTAKTRPGFTNNPGKEAHFGRKVLLGRIGETDECAGAAVFLLSQAASYITGEIIVIDGGLTVSQIGSIPPN
jgi:NAD(P)-dependent dehydrogenase (short-subunit alcohol dehydrogenase family)